MPEISKPEPTIALDPPKILPNGAKLKRLLPLQRACNEKDPKGKLCAGHLKRWYFFGGEIKQTLGADAEVYRCQKCKAVYIPTGEEDRRSGTLVY
jgi:hypothetical protein